jgi:CDGSH-type Zn-finger protein
VLILSTSFPTACPMESLCSSFRLAADSTVLYYPALLAVTAGCAQCIISIGNISVARRKGAEMTEPVSTQDWPYKVDVKEGESYFWCACGLSKKQPFCDGSHKGTGLSPVEHKATRAKKTNFCGCRKTGNQPLCDGSHNN